MPRAGVDRAVAELAQHGAGLVAAHDLERDAGADREVAADDPPAAEEVALDVEQVHRAAAPVRAAVDATEQLGHDCVGVDAAREREAVVAVGGDQHVVLLHRADRADVRCLLARGEVAVAADLGCLVLPLRLRLEGADQEHQLEQVSQLVVVVALHGVRVPSPRVANTCFMPVRIGGTRVAPVPLTLRRR